MQPDLDHTPDGPRFGLRLMFGLITMLCVVFGITSLLTLPPLHLSVALAICGLTAWLSILLFGRRRRMTDLIQVRSSSPRDEV